MARIKGVKFGSTVSNNEKVRGFYNAMSNQERASNIKRWLDKLNAMSPIKSSPLSLVIFPPYWYQDAKLSEKQKIMQDYSDFACQIQNSEIFEKVIIGRLPNPDLKLAADNRHFLTDSLVYDDLTSRKSFGSKNFFLEYCTKRKL